MEIRDPFDESRSQRINAIRSALQQKNPAVMREAIQLALFEYPADEDVKGLEQELLQLEHASSVARTLLKHGRRKVASGEYDAGIAKIRQALQMQPENREFQSALFDALTEFAKFSVARDAEKAWQLLQEATELSPLNLRLGGIRVHIVDRIREQKIVECLTSVEQLRAGGRFREAVKLVATVSRKLQPHRVPALEIVRHELLDELGIEPRKRSEKPSVETAPAVEAEAPAGAPGWNVLVLCRNAWHRLNIREPLGETRQKLAGALQQSVTWTNGGWNYLVQMKSQSAVWPAVDRGSRAAWQRLVATAESVKLRTPLRETLQGSLERAEGGWNRMRGLFARS